MDEAIRKTVLFYVPDNSAPGKVRVLRTSIKLRKSWWDYLHECASAQGLRRSRFIRTIADSFVRERGDGDSSDFNLAEFLRLWCFAHVGQRVAARESELQISMMGGDPGLMSAILMSPAAGMIVDSELRIVYVNRTVGTLLNTNEAGLLGMHFCEIFIGEIDIVRRAVAQNTSGRAKVKFFQGQTPSDRKVRQLIDRIRADSCSVHPLPRTGQFLVWFTKEALEALPQGTTRNRGLIPV